MIIPVGAGVTSALGFLVSPVASETIKSYISILDTLDWQRANSMLEAMEADGFEFLKRANVPNTEGVI